ncbi:MAG: hypothetical protein KJ787_13935 [Gammaproteobacteria bacterium]|nr:hypothetical protein [Gammaproteobacteria bacterium]MBU1647427.1 hypothetical protein [Gammaproteobacteria bacterium]MBU1973219.1 hypothetical protein [Gammaproteobacteria bacterium]
MTPTKAPAHPAAPARGKKPAPAPEPARHQDNPPALPPFPRWWWWQN